MPTSDIPKVEGIDHVHVYVTDRARSEVWYAEVLGYRRVAAFEQWATDRGPLTLENAEGNVHLALFQRDDERPASVLAFGATGPEFIRWLDHLTAMSIPTQVRDHDLSVSLYFTDLDANVLEITTYEHAKVRARN